MLVVTCNHRTFVFVAQASKGSQSRVHTEGAPTGSKIAQSTTFVQFQDNSWKDFYLTESRAMCELIGAETCFYSLYLRRHTHSQII